MKIEYAGKIIEFNGHGFVFEYKPRGTRKLIVLGHIERSVRTSYGFVIIEKFITFSTFLKTLKT